MDRKKTCSRVAASCLISFIFSLPLSATTHRLGKITQAEGEITFLNFTPRLPVKEVKKSEQLLTGGSYLTQDSSYFTVHLFDGSWIRVSPRSKIFAEFDPQDKVITIHLLTGSIKALFSSELNQKKLSKFIIKSADTTFETVDAKYTVSRNPLTDTSSVSVEKGTVIATQTVRDERKDMEIIHARETTSIQDRHQDIPSPREMSDKEMKFLHPSFYLKNISQ